MAAQKSAGVLVYRLVDQGAEFLLAHPGGPFWKKKDDGAWSIPKGLIEDGEAGFSAAAREFEEEVGQSIRGHGQPVELRSQRQPSGKRIFCWLVQADLDLRCFRSNTFDMEWPPKSGTMAAFPEIDRVEYFSPAGALRKILPGQQPFIREALETLGLRPGPDGAEAE